MLNFDQTAKGNIAFGQGQSYRGDHSQPMLRAAIAEYDSRDESFEHAESQA